MKYQSNQPWETIPFSFVFPYKLMWFPSLTGIIGGYFFDCGAFRPVNEQVCSVIRPFLPYRRTGDHLYD